VGWLSSLISDLAAILSHTVEAELRAVRRSCLALLVALSLLLAGAAVAVVGFGLLLWGLYVLLMPAAGIAGAAFITGAVALMIAFILSVVAKRTAQ